MSTSSLPDFDDDDVTGQVTRVMRDPISDPEIEIRQSKVSVIMLGARVRRIERIAWRLGATIVASSITVAASVIGAAWTVSADQARERERMEEVIRRLDRIDGVHNDR